MVRGPRRGRQGPSAKPKHDHLHYEQPAHKKPDATKTQQAEGDRDVFYDYQSHTHLKGGRMRGNQVDDIRLTGLNSKHSVADDAEDASGEEANGMRDLLQENEEGFGVVASDDDEEIDSDEAMGEGEMPLAIKKSVRTKTYKKVTRPTVRFSLSEDAETSNDESEAEKKEASGPEFIDASEMLDIGAESDTDYSDDGSHHSSASSSSDAPSEAEGLEVDLDEFEDDENFDGIENESKLDALANMINTVNSVASKRKEGDTGPIDEATTSLSKRRKVLPAQTEARPENEIFTRAEANDSNLKVDVATLLSNLPANHDVAHLKKTLKSLAKNSTKAAPLPAPLEPRLQQKIEREAAYDLTKDELDKWNETIQAARGLSGKNLDGKNRFVVPLPSNNKLDAGPDVTRWNMHFRPNNPLENEVAKLLTVGQMSSKELKQEEDNLLQAKGLTVEQIKARASELKMSRELMFRAERKAKRVAKIKSKTFRRIHKREKARKDLVDQGGEHDMDFLQDLDDIDGGDRVKDERERTELQRARERVSLKHSSQGKWAKKVAGLRGLGNDASLATRERIRREEELTRKIAGKGEEVGGSAGSDDDSDYHSDMDIDTLKKSALEQLSQLDIPSPVASEPPAKGLMAMKFMQKATARKEREANEAATELRRALNAEGNADSDEGEQPVGTQVQGNPGRLIFNPINFRDAQQTDETSRPAPEQDSLHVTSASKQTTRTSGPVVSIRMPADCVSSEPLKRACKSHTTTQQSTCQEANPWLTLEDTTGGTTSHIKTLTSSAHKDAATIVAEKAKLKALKRKRKHTSEVANAQSEAEVAIDLHSFLGSGPSTGVAVLEDMMQEGMKSKEGDAIIRRHTLDAKGRTVFEQRELVSEAFADDGVVTQFEEEKQREVELDAPRTIDVTLPGWGDWVGKGARKAKHTKKFLKKLPGIDPKARSDAKLSNVIISEKKHLKKVTKYQTKSLPFPYTSKSQHEHSLRQSIGPEFNTRLQHRHLVRPEVLSYPGQIIEPVQKVL